MTRRVVFHPLADVELKDAAQYYEGESKGLGIAFVGAVEHVLNSIVRHPLAGTLLRRVVRRRLLGGFPYAILYRVRGDTIRVLAIMNLRRRPSHWTKRKG